MSPSRKQVFHLIRLAEQQGWTVEKSKGNSHLKFVPPTKGKQIVHISSTPSDHRVMKNSIADLRRSGLKV